MARASGIPEREGTTVLADGRTLAWSEWGPASGRAVLLLHGAPGSGHACPDVDATQELGVRLIAPDRPGYGSSDPRPGRRVIDDAGDLRQLLDALGIATAAVVGWSSGSDFALSAASAFAGRTTRVAAIAGEAPFDERAAEDADTELRERVAVTRRDPTAARSAMLERTRWFAEDPMALLSRTGRDEAADHPDDRLRREPDVAEMHAAMFGHAARQGSVGWVDDAIAIQHPWGFALADVDRPVTVWFGEADRLSTRPDSELLADRLPNARLVVVPGEGHLLPVRHWREILTDVLAD